MGRNKRHHMVPELLQSRFLNEDGRFFVFDKELDSFRRDQPKNTAVRGQYYRVDPPDDEIDPLIVEDVLARIETEVPGILDRLERDISLSDGDRDSLAVFLAFQKARTTALERHIKNTAKGIAEAYRTSRGEPYVEREVRIHPNFRVGLMYMLAVGIIPRYRESSLALVGAKAEGEFCCSDSPLIVCEQNIDFIAISSSTGLLIEVGKAPRVRTGHLAEGSVKAMNQIQVRHAERQVFCRSEDTLRTAVNGAKAL